MGGAFSGLVLSWVGYQGLNMAGGLVAAAVLAAALARILAERTKAQQGSKVASG
ncbi:hypothetical protein ACW0JT_15880 [Arthrobacter sp. SA17]